MCICVFFGLLCGAMSNGIACTLKVCLGVQHHLYCVVSGCHRDFYAFYFDYYILIFLTYCVALTNAMRIACDTSLNRLVCLVGTVMCQDGHFSLGI